jgi:hypothetical protein
VVVAADNPDGQPFLVVVNQLQIPTRKFLVSDLCPSVRVAAPFSRVNYCIPEVFVIDISSGEHDGRTRRGNSLHQAAVHAGIMKGSAVSERATSGYTGNLSEIDTGAEFNGEHASTA